MIPAIKDVKNPKYKKVNEISNIKKAQENATKIYGKLGTLFLSEKEDKKYKIYDPLNKKFIHFGSKLKDYLKTNDENRRYNYLRRAMNIEGEWRNNPFSPNNLSIYINWM